MGNPHKILLILLASAVAHPHVIAAGLSPGSIAAGAVGAAVGQVAGKAAANSMLSRTPSEEQLRKIADDANKNLPQTSGNTRGERLIAGPGAQITYVYTILDATSKVLSGPQLAANEIEQKKMLCAAAPQRAILQSGVTMNYVYNGYDGKLISKIVTTAKDCGL